MATHHVVSYFPDWGLNPRFLQFKNRILTIGMPGKFPGFLVLFAGVWNTQSCGHEQSSGPLHISAHLPKVYRCSCLHRWISFSRADNMGTYKYSHRLVLTYVLMCVGLCMRTCGNTGTPRVLCFTDNALKKKTKQIGHLWQCCVRQGHRHHFSYSICSLHVSLSHFDNSCSITNHFIIIIFIILICDE